ncbi:MAG: response regulator [Chloroflexi bacterium]|nr:response regulator [Chloroflexota bacterium]
MNTNSGYLLVVEDVPDILTLLDTTLKFKGYRVLTARDGQEALEQIQKEHPALIITDILMPRMDGFSLVHRLRIEPETRSIPVIFLSATYVAPEDKAFALTIGATRFMEKPVILEEFLPLVEELLNKSTPLVVEPLSEREFYAGYRKRLEIKLAEKNARIARAESILPTLKETEKENLALSLQHLTSERHEILLLLEQVDTHMSSPRQQNET